MGNVKFSVLIPVYNAENYIERCVDSVLAQSFGDFEIILADDGSKDNSAEICKGFTDGRIKFFTKENEGPLMTRVFAASKAQGEYSVFIDCDDTVDSGYLERLNQIITEESCDMVVCSFRSVNGENITEAATPWSEKKVFSGKKADVFRKEFLLNNYLNSMCTKTIRTELLKNDSTDFSEFAQYRHGEDLIQSLYPVFNAKKIVYIPECWYNYIENDASITHNIRTDRYLSVLAARGQAYEYLKNSSFFDDETHSRYATLIVKSIMGCVKSVAKADIPQEEKVRIFDDINSNSFYSDEIAGFCDESSLDTKTKVIFKLFKWNSYKTVISLVRQFSR